MSESARYWIDRYNPAPWVLVRIEGSVRRVVGCFERLEQAKAERKNRGMADHEIEFRRRPASKAADLDAMAAARPLRPPGR